MSAYPSTPLGSCVLRVETWNPLRAAPDEEFRYIDLSAVDQDTKSITEAREIACAEAPSRARQLVRTGDVLVSTVRPNLNGVARVPNDLNGATASTGFCVLRPDPEKLSGSYLFHWVKSAAFVDDMVNKATGASYPAVSDRIIFESLFPLPPLEEQRRIAAILDQAETLRTQRRTALALLDSLTQSLFLDMFGDPVANDRGWPKVAVNDFVAGFESGKSLVADDEEDSASKYRVLKVSAVTSLEYKPGQSKAVPTDYAPPQSHIVRAGDLLFSRANTSELIGATAYVEATPDNLLLPDKLWRFVWHAPATAAPLYVMHLFRQPKFRQEIGQRASGTSGSMKNISQEKVLSIQVGNPPLPLQQTFATRIASIEALKATHRRALAALDALFSSLQQRAFTGELISSPAVQAADAADTRTKAQNFEELLQLEAEQALEALIYVAHRMPDGDLYKTHKALYFADRHHLEVRGRLIYNETYCALPHGPVPQAAYDATRVLSGERLFSDLDNDALRSALRRSGNTLETTRDADVSKLSAEALESLDWAIHYCRDMSFAQTKTASHDSAYERTPKNEAIPLQYIIDTLPPEARQRHWNL